MATNRKRAAGKPVRTFGLTHVALAVRDPQRSLRFYQAVLGVVPVYEDANFVQAQTPDSRDVLVFEPRDAVDASLGSQECGRTQDYTEKL